MRPLRKAIVNTLFALGFTLFFSLVALDPYYCSTRPRDPANRIRKPAEVTRNA
jgi:hypothetical protein